jgi:hypothetical protein
MPNKIVRVEVSTFVVHMFVKDCLRDSVWFEVTPLPDDRFEVAVKDEPSNVCESLKRYDKHMKG